MNEKEKNMLALEIQKEFPLAERPYKELAKRFSSTEEEILDVLGVWKNENRLREISAVMEGELLGYDSALVCGRIPSSELEKTAEIISRHPSVTHNYERLHEYNLWFTIGVPRTMKLESHLEALSRLTGQGPFHALRKVQTYKIGVAFNFETGKNESNEKKSLSKEIPDLKEKEINIIRCLQKDLPLVSRPFEKLCDENNVDPDDIFAFARKFMGGAVRKYVATFRHRKMGVAANGMTVWRIPQEKMGESASIFASSPAVSHCYERTAIEGFPYNLYAMMHASDRETLFSMVDEMSEISECKDYLILQSSREFKKTRLRYFLPELEEWWEKYGRLVA
ncbi:MAG: hypothetical protein OEZ34_03835 [Spirochaetia bacterium]|nr:hypothetical protein [Spirochaetia bacterium]